MANNEIEAAIQVAQARGISPRRAARLLEEFGSFGAVRAAKATQLAHTLGCSLSVAQKLKNSIRSVPATRHIRAGVAIGAEAIPLGDSRYPLLLREVCDPPTVLWVRGSTSILSSVGVAVVGARRCSERAPEITARFVAAFSTAGFSIVSGGARGVDAAAHRAALKCGAPTVVVLGSGLDQPYPPEHTRLFEEIVAAGGVLVSEYVCGVSPRPAFFPARNRIVAGMTVGVLVCEAGAKSGAMITARLAADDYGREVMVVPGSVLDGRSTGSHRALREGWAALVDCPEEAVEQLFECRGLILALREGLESAIELKPVRLDADESNNGQEFANSNQERESG